METKAALTEAERRSIDEFVERINPRNKQTIQDMYNFLVSKDKKSQLYKRILAMHTSGAIALNYGDLCLMAGMLRYKSNWSAKKAKELGI